MGSSTEKGLISNYRVKISIRTKLLLIYLLCVLVPIFIFSYIFYSSAMENIKKEKLTIFNQALDRIASSIESDALSAMSLSNAIYPDNKMYSYINNEYKDMARAHDEFNSYLRDAWLRILPYNTNIAFFSVYTDNETILNSRYIRRLDGLVTTEDWYGQLQEAKQDSLFINHIDKMMFATSTTKQLSYFRKLDFVKSRYNHYLKVTFKTDALDKAISSEILPGNIYIVNSRGQISAQSNKGSPEYDRDSFRSFDLVKAQEDQIVLERDLNVLSGWRLVCHLDKDFMQPEIKSSITQIFILIVIVALSASLIILMIAGSLYRRIDILANHMKRAELGDYRLIPDTKMGNDELGLLMNSMNKMLEKIRSLIEDVYKAKIRETQLELLKNQAELKALQGQVNPHFMFNVLETIRMKSYLKNEYETARIIRNMSFIFRKILTWPEDMVTIREEIDFIKEYLEIQKYRYEEELEYLIDVDESILDFMIPKMTLQTFVDNSCEHGFSETNGLKKLVIRGIKDEDKLILKVYDNGKGMTQDEIKNINSLSGKGIGIKNVLGRLELYYADQCEFEIDSRLGEYTKIIIRISLDQGGSQELVQGNDS